MPELQASVHSKTVAPLLLRRPVRPQISQPQNLLPDKEQEEGIPEPNASAQQHRSKGIQAEKSFTGAVQEPRVLHEEQGAMAQPQACQKGTREIQSGGDGAMQAVDSPGPVGKRSRLLLLQAPIPWNRPHRPCHPVVQRRSAHSCEPVRLMSAMQSGEVIETTRPVYGFRTGFSPLVSQPTLRFGAFRSAQHL